MPRAAFARRARSMRIMDGGDLVASAGYIKRANRVELLGITKTRW